MSEIDRLANAINKSIKNTPRGTHEFMGRTYQNEKDLTHVMDEQPGKVYPGHGWPSLAAIYKIDHFLTRGIRVYTSRPNDAEKKQLIQKYGLIYDVRKNRYTNSPEEIFRIAALHHEERLVENAITSYGELLYRSTHRN